MCVCRILARTIAWEVVDGCWIIPTPILLALPSMPKEIMAGGFKDLSLKVDGLEW